MDIKQLEAFVYTVKNKSFSKASQELFLSQPTISAHVHALEKELHTRLIERTTKEFSVTESGQKLYEYSKSILNIRKKAIDELSDNYAPKIYIGASSVPTATCLPEIIAAYHKTAPEITFQIYTSDSLDIIEKVSNRTLDIGIVGTSISDSSCTFVPLTDDELVIVAPNTSHYQELKHSHASLSTLLSEPFIIRENSSGTKRETELFLNKMNISINSLNIIASMNQPEAIIQCIGQGMGISILSKKMIQYNSSKEQFIIFPFDVQKLIRKIYFTYQTDCYLSTVALNFIHFLGNYKL